ncbi:MAG: hypothetical protein NUV98_00640 [Candidatus Roizmanbacteria bacterium]|nr:hypothetical protein [Candidatus Roizmanbacteria bacterium]
MTIGFTVSDIQDFHLYGYLLEYFIQNKKNVILLYDKEVDKITSPKNNKKLLSQYECPRLGYKSMIQCVSMAKESKCDIIITNEGQPFQGKIQLPFRMVALSWTMEYYVHGPRFLHLCERFYVDCSAQQLKKTYDLSGCNVVYEKHPKYYMLNGKSKSDVCKMLDLPDKRFVTFLAPAPAQRIDSKIKDMFCLGEIFRSLGYTIIVKQKPKCP